ncbi:hypothetical protein FB451DRAFT_1491032 [Mycena latifolia]|nr:hypothetical protein FB451DRAFT_1491032 [Mycena latifolia]
MSEYKYECRCLAGLVPSPISTETHRFVSSDPRQSNLEIIRFRGYFSPPGERVAGGVENKKYFHGQLVLPLLEPESFSLPLIQPPTPSAPSSPDVVLEPPATPAYGVADSDPNSAPGSDEQPPPRSSQDISEPTVGTRERDPVRVKEAWLRAKETRASRHLPILEPNVLNLSGSWMARRHGEPSYTDSTPASSDSSHADTDQSDVQISLNDLAYPGPAEHIPASSTSIPGIPAASTTEVTIPRSESPLEIFASQLPGTPPPRSVEEEAAQVSAPVSETSESGVCPGEGSSNPTGSSMSLASGVFRRDMTIRKRTVQLDHP